MMLDPESDRYLRLNATGRLIWEAFAEPATVAEPARVLSERSADINATAPRRTRSRSSRD